MNTETYPEGDPFEDQPQGEYPADTSWLDHYEALAPAFDPATGELIEPEPEPEPEPVQSVTSLPPAPGDAATLPWTLAGNASQAVTVGAADLTAFTNDLTAALDQRIDTQYSALMKARPAGPVTTEGVAPELRWLADADEVLSALGKVFTTRASGVRQVAGEVVQEVKGTQLEKVGGSTSVKVGMGGGRSVKTTATQATKAFAETGELVDVLVPYLLDTSRPTDESPIPEASPHAAYAAGARAMAAVLLGLDGAPGLLAAPGWKSSALDDLRLTLQGQDTPASTALAERLRKAYGRKPVGNVTTKIERVETRQVRDV